MKFNLKKPLLGDAYFTPILLKRLKSKTPNDKKENDEYVAKLKGWLTKRVSLAK